MRGVDLSQATNIGAQRRSFGALSSPKIDDPAAEKFPQLRDGT